MKNEPDLGIDSGKCARMLSHAPPHLQFLSHISNLDISVGVGAHDLSPGLWLLLVLWIPWRTLRVCKSVGHAFTVHSLNNDHWFAGLGTAGGGFFVLKLFRMGFGLLSWALACGACATCLSHQPA